MGSAHGNPRVGAGSTPRQGVNHVPGLHPDPEALAGTKTSAGTGCGRDARAPRPNHSPLEGESQKPSRQAKADAVGGGTPDRRRGSIFSIMNIDRQDGQDERDERFLHEKLARRMIRWVYGCPGLQDVRLLKTNPVYPVHRCK